MAQPTPAAERTFAMVGLASFTAPDPVLLSREGVSPSRGMAGSVATPHIYYLT